MNERYSDKMLKASMFTVVLVMQMVAPLQGVCRVARSAGLSCGESSDCAAGHCCRDAETNRTFSTDPQTHDSSPFNCGVCVAGGAQPGEVCDPQCPCPQGYTCYRRATGVCCVSPRCVTLEEAWRDGWSSFCFPRPVAPPPGGSGGLSSDGSKGSFRVRRRASSYNILCILLQKYGLI